MSSLELGRFQNSSVPVLILSTLSVPVLTGSTKSPAVGSGFKGVGSTVLTILILGSKSLEFLLGFLCEINCLSK